MTDQQIQFYKSLPDAEKHIINVAALKASMIEVREIALIVQDKYKVSQKQVVDCMELAVSNKLFYKQSDFRYDSKLYNVNISTIVYLYPLLGSYQHEWKAINVSYYHYYYVNDDLYETAKLVYSLLFDEKEYKEAENHFFRYNFKRSIPDLSDILLMESYEKVINRVGALFLRTQFKYLSDRCFRTLSSLEFVNGRFRKIIELSDFEVGKHLFTLDSYLEFHDGDFEKAVIYTEPDELYNGDFVAAVDILLSGQPDQALIQFEKGMKKQRSHFRGLVLPILPEFSLFYLIALVCSAPEVSAPFFNKYLKSLEKKDLGIYDHIFVSVAAFSLNNKQKLEESLSYLKLYTGNLSADFFCLLAIPVWFLIDKKPEKSTYDKLLQTVRKANENGYRLIANEAAFALKTWFSNDETEELLNVISKGLINKPALSLVSRQEDWEKSLNAFLAIAKGKISSGSDGGKYKLIYFVNFKTNFVQPVLLTKTNKGWSKGRNVSLKSFKDSSLEGMTEQDHRIAKHVKRTDLGWGNGVEYSFSEFVVRDLAGHPNLYLEGTDYAPVELVVAQPTLFVKKNSAGFVLSTDIKNVTKKLYVEKETNTRYKLYDLNQQQVQLIENVLQQTIVVPEPGKEKLMQVLGIFSDHMTVHSDLLATENMNVRIVPADSRIRVQLLPFGESLKAELFAKPFGILPPYCKPGKGGKTLIANDKREQLQVTRQLDQEKENESVLMDEIQALESIEQNDGLISFNQPADSLLLLEILANHTDICLVEWPEGVRFKLRGSVSFSNFNIRIKSKTDWFELEGELKVDENTILTLQQLMELTSKSRNRFIELKPGEFLALSEQLKKQLDEINALTTTGKDGLRLNKFASVGLGDLLEESENLQTDKNWKEFRKKIKNVEDVIFRLPDQLNAELRPYQEDGFSWMCRLAEWHGGACLADDMGLGKTVQTLAVLLHRYSQGPALVVCPVSVLPNWVAEIEKFATSLNIKILSGSNREQMFKSLEPGDVLLTTYGLLQSEERSFSSVHFDTIVLDEAHIIKNNATKTSKAAMKLNSNFRVALTGTPIQNHLGEVWNLFQFINPGLLGTLAHFNERFIKDDSTASRKHLKKLLSPFILRRTKSAVLDELPPKTEIIRKVQLSTEERAYYETLRRQAIETLQNDDVAVGAKHLQALAEITRLRQACCNPSLVNPALQIESAKLAMFLELVSELKENKHRALVFSQFVTHLSLVRKALDQQGVNYLYLDGSTPVSEREKRVKSFQNGEGDLFLISLKAGGLGLNLTAADYVIHMDPWWNPAVEDQASDRAHRIGQIRPVTIYRLVAEDTIEEKIIRLHSTKRDLADSLLEGSDRSAKLSLKELMELITKE